MQFFNVQRQLSTWSNALQSVAKNLDVLLYYSILGPIAIFLQLCNYQFEMSEANKSSHDWCEPKLWSIVSRPLIEKLLKCQKQTLLDGKLYYAKRKLFVYFTITFFSWVVSRFNLFSLMSLVVWSRRYLCNITFSRSLLSSQVCHCWISWPVSLSLSTCVRCISFLSRNLVSNDPNFSRPNLISGPWALST